MKDRFRVCDLPIASIVEKLYSTSDTTFKKLGLYGLYLASLNGELLEMLSGESDTVIRGSGEYGRSLEMVVSQPSSTASLSQKSQSHQILSSKKKKVVQSDRYQTSHLSAAKNIWEMF